MIFFLIFLPIVVFLPIFVMYMIVQYYGRRHISYDYTPGPLSGWIICGLWFLFITQVLPILFRYLTPPQ
jgi:hypothetical protein